MDEIIYKCMECGHKFFGSNKEGTRCPICKGRIIPVPPPKEWVKEDESGEPERIIVLKLTAISIGKDIKTLEEEYAEKFGCKVIILDTFMELHRVI